MRSYVQAVLRPLLVAPAPTVALGLPPLPGVPPVEPYRGEGWLAAAAALLARAGREADYETLAAVSGAAWRVAWRRDWQWCPSALEIYPSDPFQAVGAALDVVWRRRSGQGFLKALELMRGQLALGQPVLTSGLRGLAEWSVVVGIGELRYLPGRLSDEPPRPVVAVTARTPYDLDSEYARLEVGPWAGWLPGESHTLVWGTAPLLWLHTVGGAPPSAAELLPLVLAQALHAQRAAESGCYALGAAAYAAWAEALDDAAVFESIPPEELERRAWVDAETARRLSSARGSAMTFLAQSEPLLPAGAPRRLLALAAREYHGAALALAALARMWLVKGEPSALALANPERRRNAAAHVRSAAGHERLAAAYLERALARL